MHMFEQLIGDASAVSGVPHARIAYRAARLRRPGASLTHGAHWSHLRSVRSLELHGTGSSCVRLGTVAKFTATPHRTTPQAVHASIEHRHRLTMVKTKMASHRRIGASLCTYVRTLGMHPLSVVTGRAPSGPPGRRRRRRRRRASPRRRQRSCRHRRWAGRPGSCPWA
jgi:hypothetical protein